MRTVMGATPDATATSSPPPHVVFLETAGQGHINPTIPLVDALHEMGCKITYFAESGGGLPDDDMARADSALGWAIEEAGATLRSYRVDERLRDEEPRLAGGTNSMWLKFPALLEDLRSLEPTPSVVVYDPFVAAFPAVARLLGLPYASLVPHSGPGSMAPAETPEALERCSGAREWLEETYGIDILELGLPSASWYSPLLNLVLTSEAIFAPLTTDAQRRYWRPESFHCVGTLNDLRRDLRPAQPDFPLDMLRSIREPSSSESSSTDKRRRKRLVLLSLGSVVAGHFLDVPLGRVAPSHIKANDDGSRAVLLKGDPRGGKTLREMTGRDFIHFVFRCAVEAMGGREDVTVLLVCGPKGPEEILRGLTLDEGGEEEGGGVNLESILPPNFLPFSKVPQLDVLPLCDAFITHGGMGSVMESILHRVPMVVIPCFGDQIWNAERVSQAKLGADFRFPTRTLTAQSLRDAVLEVSNPDHESNAYRRSVEAAARRMEETGGAERAAKLVLGIAALGEETEAAGSS